MARKPNSSVSAPEVRAAASWLKRRKIEPSELSPRQFAVAAKSLNMGFKETMQFLVGQEIEIADDAQ